MPLVCALVPEPVPPARPGRFDIWSGSDVLLACGVFHDESCPWPYVGSPSPGLTPGGKLTDPEFSAWDIVDEWGAQSFPASDPPANW